MQEQNGAGHHVGMRQPAMSHAVARVSHGLNNKLFVRMTETG